MEVKYAIKLIETLGIPLAVAVALGIGLWKIIQYLLKDLKRDITAQQDDMNAALQANQTMIIRLIDRVRTLEINQICGDGTAATGAGTENRA
jgi:hypothetical protein